MRDAEGRVLTVRSSTRGRGCSTRRASLRQSGGLRYVRVECAQFDGAWRLPAELRVHAERARCPLPERMQVHAAGHEESNNVWCPLLVSMLSGA
jgi:hypothetical protein